MSCFERTIGCGQINQELVNTTITLAGWVHKRRDHGGLIFIVLRDRSGMMQIVFNRDVNAHAHDIAQMLRSEYVISVTGKVVTRPNETINLDMPTGQLELHVNQLTVLNKAKTLPFNLEEADNVDEELRLKYRYLDLRRTAMQHNIAMRHKMIFGMRQFFDNEGFYEIETPILTKNTAEGAREFLVPSRMHHGAFYALPQSPQLYKQILMAAGMEKYFQVARCFRDEDLRADRQPEFTQLDLEMSFVCEADIQSTIERMLEHVLKSVFGVILPIPLPRMTYDTAFAYYGSDKPDLRFEMPIVNVSDVFADTQLSFLRAILDKNGSIGALCVKKHMFTRSELEHWVNTALKNGAKGLIWIRFDNQKTPDSPIAKFLPGDFFDKLKALIPDLATDDTLFFVAATYKEAWTQLGKLRLQLGESLNLIDRSMLNFLWITDFPLFEYSQTTKKWTSVNHPFTSPQAGWEELPIEKMKARAYDIICNGMEVGGGSIRIHDSKIQRKVFEILGADAQTLEKEFGFLLEAQELGFPPHGGLALGIDRLLTVLLHGESIREVIAFPKTQSGFDPMMEAPTRVEPSKLIEYGLKVIPQEKK